MMPNCLHCGHVLDRIDHYEIEHLIFDDEIFDNEIYRPVGVDEGLHGIGLASDVDLRCGYCQASVSREQREFFYRRWYRVSHLVNGS